MPTDARDQPGRLPERPWWGTFLLFPTVIVFLGSPIALHINDTWGLPPPFHPGDGMVFIAFLLLALVSPVYFAILAVRFWTTRRRLRAKFALAAAGMSIVATVITYYGLLSCFHGCGAFGGGVMVVFFLVAQLAFSWLAHFSPAPEETKEDPVHDPS